MPRAKRGRRPKEHKTKRRKQPDTEAPGQSSLLVASSKEATDSITLTETNASDSEDSWKSCSSMSDEDSIVEENKGCSRDSQSSALTSLTLELPSAVPAGQTPASEQSNSPNQMANSTPHDSKQENVSSSNVVKPSAEGDTIKLSSDELESAAIAAVSDCRDESPIEKNTTNSFDDTKRESQESIILDKWKAETHTDDSVTTDVQGKKKRRKKTKEKSASISSNDSDGNSDKMPLTVENRQPPADDVKNQTVETIATDVLEKKTSRKRKKKRKSKSPCENAKSADEVGVGIEDVSIHLEGLPAKKSDSSSEYFSPESIDNLSERVRSPDDDKSQLKSTVPIVAKLINEMESSISATMSTTTQHPTVQTESQDEKDGSTSAKTGTKSPLKTPDDNKLQLKSTIQTDAKLMNQVESSISATMSTTAQPPTAQTESQDQKDGSTSAETGTKSPLKTLDDNKSQLKSTVHTDARLMNLAESSISATISTTTQPTTTLSQTEQLKWKVGSTSAEKGTKSPLKSEEQGTSLEHHVEQKPPEQGSNVSETPHDTHYMSKDKTRSHIPEAESHGILDIGSSSDSKHSYNTNSNKVRLFSEVCATPTGSSMSSKGLNTAEKHQVPVAHETGKKKSESKFEKFRRSVKANIPIFSNFSSTKKVTREQDICNEEIKITFLVLAEQHVVKNNTIAICFGKPISDWSSPTVSMEPTGRMIEVKHTVYSLLFGNLVTKKCCSDIDIPYKYVVIRNNLNYYWEQFSDDPFGDRLNRFLTVKKTDTESIMKFDDFTTSYRQLSQEGHQHGRTAALAIMSPNVSDLQYISLENALSVVSSVWNAHSNQRLMSRFSNMVHPFGFSFWSEDGKQKYFELILENLLTETSATDRLKTVVYLCILTMDPGVKMTDVNLTNKLFTILRMCLFTDNNCADINGPLFAILTSTELITKFIHSLAALVTKHLKLLESMLEHRREATVCTIWLFALPYLKCVEIDQKEKQQWWKDILYIWKKVSLGYNKNRLTNIHLDIMKLNSCLNFIAEPFLELCDPKEYLSLFSNSDLIFSFDGTFLLIRFFQLSRNLGQDKIIEITKVLQKHLVNGLVSASPENLNALQRCIQTFLSNSKLRDVKKEILFLCAHILIAVKKRLGLYQDEQHTSDLLQKNSTVSNQLCDHVLLPLERKSSSDDVLAWSVAIDVFSHLDDECQQKLERKFSEALSHWSAVRCIAAFLNAGLTLNPFIAHTLIDKIFENPENIRGQQDSFLKRILKWIPGAERGIVNLVHFVSKILLMYEIPSTLNEIECCTVFIQVTKLPHLSSILKCIPQVEEHLPPEAVSTLTLIKDHLQLFTSLLGKGTLNLKTLGYLEEESHKFHYLEFCNFFKLGDHVNDLVNRRLQEIKAFRKDISIANKFLAYFSRWPEINLFKEKMLIKIDEDNLILKNACKVSDISCQTDLSFKSNTFPQEVMATMLQIVERLGSNCFQTICQCHVVNYLEHEKTKGGEVHINFEDVVVICTGVLDNFAEFLEELQSGSIILQKVKELFEELYHKKDLQKEMDILKHFVIDERWNPVISRQIKQFFMMVEYTEIAKTINEVKNALNLDKPFPEVNIILKTIDDTDSFLENELSVMNEDLIRYGETFSKWTPPLLDALKTLCKCGNLLNWIRKNLTSTQELKVYVDLASISAGESDIDVDRVLCLQSAVMAYSPLIFDLTKASEMDSFLQACISLSNAVSRDCKIPDKLLDSNRIVPWLESIQDRHGSVEGSSLNIVNLIYETGVYEVSISKHKSHTVSITLTYDQFHAEHGDSDRRTLSLEEIQELESKLMLISVGQDQMHQVNRFTEILHDIMLVSRHLSSLLEDGSLFISQFTCLCYMNTARNVSLTVDLGHKSGIVSGSQSLEQELKDLGHFLEGCRDSWRQHIRKLRSDHPVLNYFTTDQLVLISASLADLLNKKTSLARNVEMLLRLLAPASTREELEKVLIPCLLSEDIVGISDSSLVPGQSDKNVRSFIEHIVEEYALDEKLVKSAVQATQEISNAEEVVQWCLENSDQLANFVERCDGDIDVENVLTFIADIVDTFSFDEKLVKAAIHATKEMSDSEIVAKWCVEHADDIDILENIPESLDEAANNQTNYAWEMSKQMDTHVSSDITLLNSLDEHWNRFLQSVNDVEAIDFVSFMRLAACLEAVTAKLVFSPSRQFPPYFNKGKPNLVVCSQRQIYHCVLTLYHFDETKPLPSLDEVLICNPETSREQIELHCLRAFQDQSGRIFSIIHADKIDFETSCHIESLFMTTVTNHEYQLVFFSSKENDSHSFISTAFEKYHVNMSSTVSPALLQSYLQKHLKSSGVSSIEIENCSLRLLASDRPGNGKSLLVKRMTKNIGGRVKTIAVHENQIDDLKIIDSWLMTETERQIFHLDLTPVAEGCDDLLFSLAVMQGLSNSTGKIWKCTPSQVYLIELTIPHPNEDVSADGSSNQFKYLLPTVWCMSPQETLESYRQNTEILDGCYVAQDSSLRHLMDQEIFRSEIIQRPYQYLTNAQRPLDNFSYNNVQGNPLDCLDVLLRHCCVTDPTWVELLHFCRFLNVQLLACEQSIFCNVHIVGDTLPGFKNFVVKFLIRMSKDFATRSVDISDQSVQLPEITDRNRWESSAHPYIFFNEDGHTLSFFGFRIINCNLIDEKTGNILENNFMPKNLYNGLTRQGVDFNTTFERMSQPDLRRYYIEQLCMVFGVPPWRPTGQEDFYELTTDNVLKMLAIHMRFRARIPVLIMGETGTGKTRLIRFICDILRQNKSQKNMIILKCHGAIDCSHIYAAVRKAILQAKVNIKAGIPQTVLFFDEANTTNAIGAIKEVMCDGLVDGEPIPDHYGLKFIAAVNPYREHSAEMISKLENAGLGYHLKAESTTDRLGKIPMRRLVYRVRELPASMFSLIWDFGTLDDVTEQKYIIQMVQHHIQQCGWVPGAERQLVDVLSACQQFMRKQRDECSFVSLRDVERALTVLQWFHSKSDCILSPLKKKGVLSECEIKPTDFTISLILSVGISYYVRLEKQRSEFVSVIQPSVLASVCDHIPNIFVEIIRACQDLFINEMKLDHDISRNEALKENIWMMAICIELKIPLFLVGKPGSSKSLAKTVVTDVMQGESSYSLLFRQFKEVHMISFQCSPLATAKGIHATFKQCQKFQEKQDPKRFSSVVVLDEVGLAEDSPKMPLKTLHPLLEDGCLDDEVPKQYKKVAFIGISNWALDPAKMNRGILVSRGNPSCEDLIKTARDICRRDNDAQMKIEPYIEELVHGYDHLYKTQEREYYGLRDFYSLVKMLFAVCQKKDELRHEDIILAVRRCFGGYFGDLNPAAEVLGVMSLISYRLRNFDDPSLSNQLVKTALTDTEDKRYILFLTKNNAALTILQEQGYQMDVSKTSIIFGSSFPHDQEYTRLYQNINRIKMAMETGRTVILCNLTNLYESLYDALNQSYIYLGGSRYVDLGLGTHRVKCRVHPDFRLIVVAEDTEVYQKFPIPLINRLEKHFLGMQTLLTPELIDLVERLKQWSNSFARVSMSLYETKECLQYTPGDAFIGFHEDAPASIILRIVSYLTGSKDSNEILTLAKATLLQCSTPDAISRLRNSHLPPEESEQIFHQYHTEQHHQSLSNFVSNSTKNDSSWFIQVTTHCRLMTVTAKNQLAKKWKLKEENIQLLSLQQMDTEEQFRKVVDRFLITCGSDVVDRVLIVQCEMELNNRNGNLLECARFCVQDRIGQFPDKKYGVIFLVNLPRVAGGSLSGFPGTPWLSVHIDEVFQAPHHLALVHIKNKSVSKILAESDDAFWAELLMECLPKSASQIGFNNGSRVNEIIGILSKILISNTDISNRLSNIFRRKIVNIQEKCEENIAHPEEWLVSLATDCVHLQEGCTFQQTVWLVIVAKVVPHFSFLLQICDLDRSLDHLRVSEKGNHLDIFLDTLDHIQLTDNLFSRDNFAFKMPKNFVGRVPMSWVHILSLERLSNTIAGDQLSLQSVSKSNSRSNFLLKVFKLDDTVIRLFINDLLVIKFPEIAANEVVIKVLTECVYNDIISCYNAKATTMTNDVSEETERSISPEDIYLSYSNLEKRLLFFLDLVRLYPSILEHPKLLEIKVGAFCLDVESIEAALKCLDPNDKELADYAAQKDWVYRLSETKTLFGRYLNHIQSVSTDQELINQIQHLNNEFIKLEILKMFFELVLPEDMTSMFRKCTLHSLKLLKFSIDIENIRAKGFTTLLNALKSLSVKTSRLHFTGGVDKCSICQEAMSDPVALECGHIFCHGCIQTCMRTRLNAGDGKEWNCPSTKCRKMYPSDYEFKNSTECREAVVEYQAFCKRLNHFFLEFLQRFIFSEIEIPGENVIKTLISFVITGELPNRLKPSTKQFSPFSGDYVDSTPVVRSLVLQLLLKCNWEEVKTYLEDVINAERRILDNPEHLEELFLLFVYSMEDSLSSKAVQSLPREIEEVPGIHRLSLIQIRELIQRNASVDLQNCTIFETLRFLAETRIALRSVAALIQEHVDVNELSEEESDVLQQALILMDQTKCDQMKDFVARELAKTYSINSIIVWKDSGIALELLPRALQISQLRFIPDFFILYGETYLNLRNVIRTALIDGSLTGLEATLSRCTPQLQSHWILALFYLTNVDTTRKDNLEHFARLIKDRNPELGSITNLFLVENSPAFELLSMLRKAGCSQQNKSVHRLLFHLSSVLTHCQQNRFTQIFRLMYTTPTQLIGTYLPTMPQDDDYEARSVVTDIKQLYYCPNDHVYGVGDCGKFRFIKEGEGGSSRCPTCDTAIGANQTGASAGQVREATLQDSTQPGHILGSNFISPVMRHLNALQVAIFRILLHGAMFLGATLAEEADEIVRLITPPIATANVTTFLFDHLRQNINQVTQLLGRSQDDVEALLHSVIIALGSSNLDTSVSGILTNRQERHKWEVDFKRLVIDPVIIKLDDIVGNFQQSLAAEKDDGQKPLLTILEGSLCTTKTSDPGEPNIFSPVFWQPRSMVSMASLEQKVGTERLQEECPNLFRLLRGWTLLTRTPNLSPIMRLQAILFDKFQGRIEPSDLETTSILSLLYKNDFIRDHWEELKELIQIFLSTLIELRSEVFNFDQYGRAAETHCQLKSLDLVGPPDLAWPCGLLFPTNYGFGLCAKVLVQVLISAHNTALPDTDVTEENPATSNLVSPLHIPPESVVGFHPDQLRLLLLANSRYSLTAGESTQWDIDLESLERQTVDRYFRFRQRIDPNQAPLFHFDSSTDLVNGPSSHGQQRNIRLHPHVPQTLLTTELKHQLESDLGGPSQLPDLCRFLDQLRLTRNILHLNTAPSTTSPLADYMTSRLGLRLEGSWVRRNRFLSSLKLGHLDSLVDSLQLLRARRMVARKHNPWYARLSDRFQEPLPSFAHQPTGLSTNKDDSEPPVSSVLDGDSENLGDTTAQPETSKMSALLHHLQSLLLLSSFHSFVERLARNENEIDPTFSLVESIVVHLEDDEVSDDIVDLFRCYTPDYLLVKHAYACFSWLVEAIDQQELQAN